MTHSTNSTNSTNTIHDASSINATALTGLTTPTMDFNVVILAAGQGTRMMSRLPKVLHPLAGVPMVLRVLHVAQGLSPTPKNLVVVIGHGGEQVQAALPVGTITAVQTKQKGTGHAVAQALPYLDPTLATLVLCGDVPCIQASDLQALLAITAQGTMGVLTAMPTNPTGYGRIECNSDGTVQRIIEHKDCTPAQQLALTEVNTGVMLLPAGKVALWLAALQPNNSQGEYYLTDCVAQANAAGIVVHKVPAKHAWQTEGVNSRAQLAALERLHQQAIAHELMAQGVSLADPARLDVRGTIHCEPDVTIDVGCVFEGTVSLGSGVHIGAHCVLKNCHIAADTHILPFTHIDGACVGAGSRVGPYARLRPGTELGEACHVGNFVELKNTHMAMHSKANHLSYLGDTTLGSGVNIGAGVITCNYDGANKHHTIVGDNAFIGSDVQLIAPITVGAGATIGAGTTLTKDAPPHQLTVSRVKQVSVANWQRPIQAKAKAKATAKA